MAIYEITTDQIRKIPETTFSLAGLRERYDLQRLLRSQFDVISPDTLIIAGEFGEWDSGHRRIDLLGIDKNANLVIVELKRTEDGGHMELQAIRYAAMVSAMTFDQAVEVYASLLRKEGSNAEDAQALILSFLEWEEPDEDRFAQDVRIILVAADFSKELTTSVMWLNERDLDIRCIRLKAYGDNGRVLIDVQQVIPLPEAIEYQVQIRQKERLERKDRIERHVLRKKFWTELLKYSKTQTTLHGNISPGEYHWIGTGMGVRGLTWNYVIGMHDGGVELYIDRGNAEENKTIFDRLIQDREKVEKAFGEPLDWQRLDDKRACRIKKETTLGGYRNPEDDWQQIICWMVASMIRLEAALGPSVVKVRTEVLSHASGPE
jgi:Domain of unknown function (DUF4268)